MVADPNLTPHNPVIEGDVTGESTPPPSSAGLQHVDWSSLPPPPTSPTLRAITPRDGSVASVLALVPELLACHSVDALLKRAVELARERIGVERCAIFLPDSEGRQLRGTWGTSISRQTTDERNLIFELGHHDQQAIELLRQGEARWVVVNGAARGHTEGEQARLLSFSWVVLTPIQSVQGNLAFFFNDAAVSGTPVCEHQQELVAIFCALVGQIAERRRAEGTLRQRSLIDPVTHLPSHALFLDRIGRRTAQIAERGAGYTVLSLGIERWGTIAQRHAPRFLELLASAIGSRISHCLGPSDSATRIGGDEFAILGDRTGSEQEATALGRRILEAISQPFEVESERVHLAASIGFAQAEAGPVAPEEHLQNARAALTRARSLGPGHIQPFDPSHREVVSVTHQLETHLVGALERAELLLHYQPIVTLADMRVKGFEALLRWQHPRRGLVPPSTFIPLAEETELIVAIGAWVMREACHNLRAWQQEIPGADALSISVNLSPRQFMDEGLVSSVEAALRVSGLNANHLILEITESSVMRDLERASVTLGALRSLGVRIALDDFGTGYSSLSYLYRLPLDVVKVDRSFVVGLGEDRRSSAIVRSILELGKNLDLGVVVEGVENERQLAVLKALACEFAQGHLLARPLDELEARDLLAKRPILGGRR
jgi:diguanylate cyclase (GGDEF)-like protein